MQALPLKCVIVGDGCVGKTCLVMSYTQNAYPGEYVPTVFDNYQADILVNGQVVSLSVWDTAGQHEYDRLRSLSYPMTDVFVICFSIDSRISYRNVKDQWFSEVRHYCPDIPIVLVGTKVDLRGEKDPDKKVKANISLEEGRSLAQKIKAVSYVECSAKTGSGVQQMFEEAIQACLAPRKTHKRVRKCKVL